MDKVALVTGSRRGIGLAILKALAGDGYAAVMSDIVSEEEARPALNELYPKTPAAEGVNAAGRVPRYIRCDISAAADRQNLIDTVIREYGRLDVLVNNAGVAPKSRLDILETTEESFDFLLSVNLKGTFFMCQAAANAMIGLQKENIEGYAPRIVNISSVSAYASSTNRGEYCVSKAGISMTTLLFADRLAAFGIPVFEVRPGIIMTDMTAGVKDKYDKMIAEGVTPIRRFGRPEDVADCVMAAAGGRLDFATGQVLNADGGFSIRRL
ncbi:MAG: 3-ketoacyl-ACP reductase [Firmicutes bacterium]|nr:3-ketoacyl-ACP reductase [Bacillota bacterium]